MALFDPSCWVSRGLSRDQFHFLSLLLCWTTCFSLLERSCDRVPERRCDQKCMALPRTKRRFRIQHKTQQQQANSINSKIKFAPDQTIQCVGTSKNPRSPCVTPFSSHMFMGLSSSSADHITCCHESTERALSSCNLRPRAVSLLRGFVHTLTKILSTDTKCGRRLAVAGVAAGRLLLLLSGCNFIDRFHAHRLVID